jgi:CubicO group peptidase (beta-lactamase class C family)
LSEQSRALPDRPDLRYLKIEAKRRLAAGEFNTLHDAQLTIAREHGRSSWAALKESVAAARERDHHALTQVRWLVSRFTGADAADWVAPAEDELRRHFDDRYLTLVPPDTMIRTLRSVAAGLRQELVVTEEAPLRLRARIADLRVEAATEPDPPHRLTGLRIYPEGGRVTDRRTEAPSTRTDGDLPAAAIRVADGAFTELGLAGIVVAGSTPHGPQWSVARGWADLERDEPLRVQHRFPVYGLTKPVTAVAVLRLVAEGRIELDRPANRYLRASRLADDRITVRELVNHTGGVDNPETMFADSVPDSADVLGAVIGCGGVRGTFATSNGGYAVLGRLIADVSERSYPAAVAAMVLRPLGMLDSSFPTRWPDGAVISGHRLAEDGSFEPVAPQVATLPAAAGLWSTAGDLVRFGRGWPTLLPEELAREALRRPEGLTGGEPHMGLGWMVNPGKDVYGHPGIGPSASVSLIIGGEAGGVSVVATNRRVPVESVNARLVRPVG